MGDSVNLGSRIESLTKNYGVNIIVSEFVKAQTPDMVYRELDIVRVKGKDRPVSIFEPLGTPEQVSKQTLDELDVYHEMIRNYCQQAWDLAEKQLKKMPQKLLYALYAEHIKQFKKSPPGKDWDGVFNYESK